MAALPLSTSDTSPQFICPNSCTIAAKMWSSALDQGCTTCACDEWGPTLPTLARFAPAALPSFPPVLCERSGKPVRRASSRVSAYCCLRLLAFFPSGTSSMPGRPCIDVRMRFGGCGEPVTASASASSPMPTEIAPVLRRFLPFTSSTPARCCAANMAVSSARARTSACSLANRSRSLNTARACTSACSAVRSAASASCSAAEAAARVTLHSSAAAESTESASDRPSVPESKKSGLTVTAGSYWEIRGTGPSVVRLGKASPLDVVDRPSSEMLLCLGSLPLALRVLLRRNRGAGVPFPTLSVAAAAAASLVGLLARRAPALERSFPWWAAYLRRPSTPPNTAASHARTPAICTFQRRSCTTSAASQDISDKAKSQCAAQRAGSAAAPGDMPTSLVSARARSTRCCRSSATTSSARSRMVASRARRMRSATSAFCGT
mmetsp:Transcript_20656/g.64077  ORF Transcript_20656/g.64077 Transcript_20656/m.64077 type:complete len:436 (-) Transcript_20656:479-1786(-)